MEATRKPVAPASRIVTCASQACAVQACNNAHPAQQEHVVSLTTLPSTELSHPAGMHHAAIRRPPQNAASWLDWISDTLSQEYIKLQSLVKSVDHRNTVSDTVCSQAKIVLGCAMLCRNAV